MAYRINTKATYPFAKTLISAAIAFASSLPLLSQDLASVRNALEAKYARTTTTADKRDIVKAGDVLVLKKSGLVTVDAKSRSVFQNKYVNGQIKANPFQATNIAKWIPGAKDLVPSDRTFFRGEKIWLTAIEVRESGVVFSLFTDAYSETRYDATLAFPFEKGSNPTAARTLALVGEVFDIQAGEDAKSVRPAPPAESPTNTPKAAVEVAPPPIAPPPPPPADPKVISLGQTINQVTRNFGQPDSISKVGNKQIYLYKDLEVTFVGGKVTDIQ